MKPGWQNIEAHPVTPPAAEALLRLKKALETQLAEAQQKLAELRMRQQQRRGGS